MKYGVVLPIWRLTIADAERMTLRAEELGWDGVLAPDHILAKPATTEHYGPTWPDTFAPLLPRRADTPHPGRRERDRAAYGIRSSPPRPRPPSIRSGGRFIFGVGVGSSRPSSRTWAAAFGARGHRR